MSLKILKSFQLDFAKAPSLDYIFAKQGDQDSRILEITPLNNGMTYTIPEGTTARFGAKKPDGTQILNDAVIENGNIYVTLSAQALAVSGAVTAEIALYGTSDELLSSQHFHIMVERFAVDPDAVESSDEYQSFETALLELEEAIQAAENVNITAEETASGYTVTITNRDGESSTVDIETGGASVIANPELEGGEDTLKSIEIDDTKFKVDSFETDVTTSDKAPYLFRTSGGGVDIGKSKTIKNIIGATIAFNQLVDSNTTSVVVLNSHKYISKIGDVWTCAISDGTAVNVTGGSDCIFDISHMFGSAIANYIYSLEQANAGDGIAWFKCLFPKDYYSYNAGQLISVKTSANVMTGFNAYNNLTGKAKLLGGMLYQITGTYTSVSYTNINGDSETLEISANGYFTPANNGELTVTGGNATDTCVHLVWDGERDGEWEQYIKHEYALDSDLELRGILKLDANNNLYYDGDEYSGDGTVKRKYGIVDLGSLIWKTAQGIFYSTSLSTMIKTRQQCKLICSKYETNINAQGSAAGAAVVLSDKQITQCFSTTLAPSLYIKDSDYATAAAFGDAMSGVYLVYELSEPASETADEYTSLMDVDDWGTEEFVDSRSVSVPVGHDTDYEIDLKAKLEMAPNSPDADGLYIVKRLNGVNNYIQYISPVPDLPSSNGTYTLKCTVSGNTKTVNWVSAT